MKTESFITLLIGAGLGIILGQADIFGLMIITIILIVLFIIIGLASLSSENKFTSQALFLTILSFSMVISCGVGRSIDSETAEDIIIKLDEYKNVNGNYPANLNEIGIEKTTYSYGVDSLQEDFSISYIVDGWHYSEYSSKTKEWITTD
jgi:uncharacterized membrane protein YfhO